MQEFDRSLTLEELEGTIWPHSEWQSHVAVESQRLRKVPVGQLTVEDLRLLIGQKIGLRFLVPIALEHLWDDPLVAGDLYRGDLLQNVVRLPEEFWNEYPELNNSMVELATEVKMLHSFLSTHILPALNGFDYRP